MKVIKLACHIAICAGLFLAGQNTSAHESYASDEILPKKIEIDGSIYDQNQLMDAFLDVAFSGNINVDGSFPKGGYLLLPTDETSGPDTFFQPERVRQEYPWLYEYLFRVDGNPSYFALNKWAKDIQISTGMPNDLRPVHNTEKSSNTYYYLVDPSVSANQDHLKLVESELSAFMEKLKGITGLHISYLEHGNETADNFGNVRLVFVDRVDGWESTLKLGSADIITSTNSYPKPIFFRENVEKKLHTAVRFTPSSLKQVDGFFLSNSKNEIEFAICYIWNGHEPQMILALVRECLIRALGMPDASDQFPAALSGLWNDRESWPISKTEDKLSPPSLTEADEFLLRLLYNPSLKAGMSITDAQKTLLNTWMGSHGSIGSD